MSLKTPSTQRVAVIDLGTNTFHLLIAEIGEGNPQLLHREKVPVKIGMGGINQKTVTVEATKRALACMHHFSDVLRKFEVSRTYALGTSALRNAENGKDIILRIAQETGIVARVISGPEEAEYIYYGIRAAMDLGTEPCMIVDIGGGSVEFIIGSREKMLWKSSVEMGAQRLLEMYQRHDPILKEEVNQLIHHFRSSLAEVAQAIQTFKPEVLVGSSGTFDTLSEIYCLREHIPVIPDARETPLTVKAFHEIHHQLLTLDRSGRLKIPGMIEMRVDMIVVASCLVEYLLLEFGFKKIRVSSFSLKEGVLATLS